MTQNKLGDLLYRNGNLEAALGLYKKALSAREAISASIEGSEKSLAELDVAFSLAKAADIEQVSRENIGSVGSLIHSLCF